MNTSISLPSSTEKKIRAREGLVGTFSGQVNDDLTLLWALLDRGRQAIRGIFTRPEIMLVLDALKDTTRDASHISVWIWGGLAHQVSDAITRERLTQKWDIDSPGLLKKISNLSDLETVALLDFCRDMWRKNDTPSLWEAEISKWQE